MRNTLVVAVLGVLASLTACGNEQPAASPPANTSSAAPTTTSSNATAAIEAAVRAYSDAYLNGKGEAYDLLSTRCKERTTRSAFINLITMAKQTYGPQQISTFKVEQQSGDLARVTYTYAAKPDLDQRSEPWVREGGAWKEDDC